ncbi:hypothetical protein GCT13_42100 [Paraburkholderia sp. CNPSo 3157]|uniref:Uncharacterized protein n=1 Tax=Paraburkholderia franconis TaxID=2654983 RepID=A0A7X1TL84_9BURK|nr:hypothetical protein [Paraburkholderia franconis]
MRRNTSAPLYVVLLIAVVVSVDLLFFRTRFWERLQVNIGIVLVFAAFYLRLLKAHRACPLRHTLNICLARRPLSLRR